eukprot:SAG31_NODE_45837_length_257_cov_0.651899_1_plen_43_part_01
MLQGTHTNVLVAAIHVPVYDHFLSVGSPASDCSSNVTDISPSP